MTYVEILRAACCVAGLDQEICEKERPLLDRLALAAGVGEVSFKAMMDRAKCDSTFFQEMFKIVKADPDAAFKIMLSVAIADGKFTTDERVVLHHFAEKLGLSDARSEQLLAAAEKRVTGS